MKYSHVTEGPMALVPTNQGCDSCGRSSGITKIGMDNLPTRSKPKMDGWDKFLYFVLWPPPIVGTIWLGYILIKDTLQGV